MNTEIVPAISKEEIDWVKSKHDGILRSGQRIYKEAIEIGAWFIDAEERTGLKKQGRGGTWVLWLKATFPEMSLTNIRNYMRLARNQDYLEKNYNSSAAVPTIVGALRVIALRNREANKATELDLPPAEFDEPLLILRDELKSFVHQQFQLDYLETQIRFRIKNAKLGRRQIRQAIEWATQEHLEVKEKILKIFLR